MVSCVESSSSALVDRVASGDQSHGDALEHQDACARPCFLVSSQSKLSR